MLCGGVGALTLGAALILPWYVAAQQPNQGATNFSSEPTAPAFGPAPPALPGGDPPALAPQEGSYTTEVLADAPAPGFAPPVTTRQFPTGTPAFAGQDGRNGPGAPAQPQVREGAAREPPAGRPQWRTPCDRPRPVR